MAKEITPKRLKEMNERAIKRGDMLRNDRSYHDYYNSDRLGEELNPDQQRMYSIIYDLTKEKGHATTHELTMKFYGYGPRNSKKHLFGTYEVIDRIKEKLGEDSIAHFESVGYVATRALIENRVNLVNRLRIKFDTIPVKCDHSSKTLANSSI